MDNPENKIIIKSEINYCMSYRATAAIYIKKHLTILQINFLFDSFFNVRRAVLQLYSGRATD